MINATNEFIILNRDNLDAKIRSAIMAACNTHKARYGKESELSKGFNRQSFIFFFSRKTLKTKIKFDELFLKEIFAFTAISSRNESCNVFIKNIQKYISTPNPSAVAIPQLKQGLKQVIFELWKNDVILVPTTFKFGSHFRINNLDNEVFDFIQSYFFENIQNGSLTKKGFDDARRIQYYMPPILTASSWKKIEDISIYEIADFHRAQLLFLAGKSAIPVLASSPPFSLFLNELLEKYQDRVSYSKNDLIDFSKWSNGGHYEEFSFSEFQEEKNKHRPKVKREKINAGEPKRAKISYIDKLLDLSKNSSHKAALKYFQDYKDNNRDGINWMESSPSYPGREYISKEIISKYWHQSFKLYLSYRTVRKEYESNKEAISAINILADYVFLYIPWWKEINPTSKLSAPISPKYFNRYLFVERIEESEKDDELPLTLKEIIKLRRKTSGSQYNVLQQIGMFFEYIENNLSEHELIAGKNFKSPVRLGYDLPLSSKPSKTTKIVFPKSSYGLLTKYGYAVESFGEFLLERSLAGEHPYVDIRELHSKGNIETERFGYIPYVEFRGKITPIFSIPRIFNWKVRKINTNQREEKYVLIPHLTRLRALQVAVETGLRMVGIRWLDKRTWDEKNSSEQDISNYTHLLIGDYTYSLYVNTDKSKNSAWETVVVFRVRSLLQREQKFQEMFSEDFMNFETIYQNRKKSRFGKILPLFRSEKCHLPITHDEYSEAWTLHLLGFQDFYKRATGTFVDFVYLKPTSGTREAPQVKATNTGALYCPLSMLAINTPHSCRASFATNRQGTMEVSEVAQAIGHSSVKTTVYYQKPAQEDLKKKLEASDKEIMEDFQKFDKSNESYIRADKEDSTLVRNFRRDRPKTLAEFGFMPPIAMWSISDSGGLSETDIENLRNGPMSTLVFTATHICPVGEECPSDIVVKIGGFKRCGLCPLALKCIEHLPAIAAKKKFQIERIKYLHHQIKPLEEAGENRAVEDIWEEMELETNELLGWQLSEEILSKLYLESLNNEKSPTKYLTERPDIVRLHLQSVTKASTVSEFILTRIAESNAYPTLQSPQIQAIARNISRRLLSGQNPSELLSNTPGPSDVEIAANLLKTLMHAYNLTIDKVIELLENEKISLPSSAPLRIASDA